MQRLKPWLLVVALAGWLVGCDQQAMIEKFIPKEEEVIARQILVQLAARDFAAINPQLDSSLNGESVQAALKQMADLIPRDPPKSIQTIGAFTSTFNDVTTYTLTFEHEYSKSWLMTQVVLQRRGTRLTVLAMHATPMQQSLKTLNRFTFAGKGLLHYLVLGLAIAIPLFVVVALVLCYRTPIAKRKWLWMLFVAFGVVQCSFNWTDGSYAIQPLRFLLLGAGFVSGSPYAPTTLAIAFPLPAVIFLLRRRALAATHGG